MKKRWIGLVIILIVAILILNPESFSTKLLAKILGEYEDPEFVADQKVLDYLGANNVYYDHVCRFKDMNHMEKFSQAGLLQVPLIYIFDKNKNLLVMAESEKCVWALSTFFIHGESLVPKQDSSMFEILRENTESISINTASNEIEYYIITGWAMFVPKKSKMIFDRIREFQDTRDNIYYINLNMDFRNESITN